MGVLLHGRGDKSGGITRCKGGTFFRHRRQSFTTASEVANRSREPVARQFVLLHQNRCARAGKYFRVTRLVIVGRVGERNQDRWQGVERQFRETGGAGSGHGKVGRAVRLFHSMMERRNKGADVIALIIIRHQPLVPGSGEVNDLQLQALQRG